MLWSAEIQTSIFTNILKKTKYRLWHPKCVYNTKKHTNEQYDVTRMHGIHLRWCHLPNEPIFYKQINISTTIWVWVNSLKIKPTTTTKTMHTWENNNLILVLVVCLLPRIAKWSNAMTVLKRTDHEADFLQNKINSIQFNRNKSENVIMSNDFLDCYLITSYLLKSKSVPCHPWLTVNFTLARMLLQHYKSIQIHLLWPNTHLSMQTNGKWAIASHFIFVC